MFQDRLAEAGESKLAACNHVGGLLGINQATLRNWVEDRHVTTARTVSEAAQDPAVELAALGKENAELRRANVILGRVGFPAA
jgi:transposase-like protein